MGASAPGLPRGANRASAAEIRATVRGAVGCGAIGWVTKDRGGEGAASLSGGLVESVAWYRPRAMTVTSAKPGSERAVRGIFDGEQSAATAVTDPGLRASKTYLRRDGGHK